VKEWEHLSGDCLYEADCWVRTAKVGIAEATQNALRGLKVQTFLERLGKASGERRNLVWGVLLVTQQGERNAWGDWPSRFETLLSMDVPELRALLVGDLADHTA
jgi:hypothetical protein